MKNRSINWIILTVMVGLPMFNNTNCFAGGNHSKITQDQYGEVPITEQDNQLELNLEDEGENQGEQKEENREIESERRLKQAIADLKGKELRIYGKEQTKPVQFPQMIIHVSPYIQNEIINDGTGEIHLPNISRNTLLKLEQAIEILSYQGKDESGNTVPLDQITEKTRFEITNVRHALKNLVKECDNIELGELFRVVDYLKIDQVRDVIAYYIADRISFYTDFESHVIKTDLFSFRFGLFTEEQIRLIRKHINIDLILQQDTYTLGKKEKEIKLNNKKISVKRFPNKKRKSQNNKEHAFYCVEIKNTGSFPLYFNLDNYIQGELNIGESVKYQNVFLNRSSIITLESRKRKRNGSGYCKGAIGEIILQRQYRNYDSSGYFPRNAHFTSFIYAGKNPIQNIPSEWDKSFKSDRVLIIHRDSKCSFWGDFHEVDQMDTIDRLLSHIARKLKQSKNELKLIYKNVELDSKKTIADYDIQKESMLYVMLKSQSPAAIIPQQSGLRIWVRCLGGSMDIYDMKLEDKLEELWSQIYAKTGWPPELTRLIYQGRQLRPSDTICGLRIRNDDVIHKVFRG